MTAASQGWECENWFAVHWSGCVLFHSVPPAVGSGSAGQAAGKLPCEEDRGVPDPGKISFFAAVAGARWAFSFWALPCRWTQTAWKRTCWGAYQGKNHICKQAVWVIWTEPQGRKQDAFCLFLEWNFCGSIRRQWESLLPHLEDHWKIKTAECSCPPDVSREPTRTLIFKCSHHGIHAAWK